MASNTFCICIFLYTNNENEECVQNFLHEQHSNYTVGVSSFFKGLTYRVTIFFSS